MRETREGRQARIAEHMVANGNLHYMQPRRYSVEIDGNFKTVYAMSRVMAAIAVFGNSIRPVSWVDKKDVTIVNSKFGQIFVREA